MIEGSMIAMESICECCNCKNEQHQALIRTCLYLGSFCRTQSARTSQFTHVLMIHLSKVSICNTSHKPLLLNVKMVWLSSSWEVILVPLSQEDFLACWSVLDVQPHASYSSHHWNLVTMDTDSGGMKDRTHDISRLPADWIISETHVTHKMEHKIGS